MGKKKQEALPSDPVEAKCCQLLTHYGDCDIAANHLQEWLNSGVDEALVRLNVISLSGYKPYEYLCYGLPNSERRNDGRLRYKWLKR